MQKIEENQVSDTPEMRRLRHYTRYHEDASDVPLNNAWEEKEDCVLINSILMCDCTIIAEDDEESEYEIEIKGFSYSDNGSESGISYYKIVSGKTAPVHSARYKQICSLWDGRLLMFRATDYIKCQNGLFSIHKYDY